MAFKTKLDFSNNRQVKQNIETITVLSGATSFGVPFSSLPSGPNLTTTGLTSTSTFLLSTFSGNSATTVYSWYDPFMETAISSLLPITPTNSGITQHASGFTGNPYVMIDGNSVATAYTGVTFDLTPIAMYDLGGGNYVGSVQSDFVDYYSASTLDFTGRTIWNDVSGITRTQDLIITNNANVGSIFTCIDSEGKGNWIPVSAATNQYFTSGSTGYYSIKTINDSGTDATGNYAFAEGNNTLALGTYSHAEGRDSIATGDTSHVEGFDTKAYGDNSHAQNRSTSALGYSSHAEGYYTIAQGEISHSEGNYTIAQGDNSHAEGDTTQANGNASHAENYNTQAFGLASHAEGIYTQAIGEASHAEGNNSRANGNISHAEGYNTRANGEISHAEGWTTISSGLYSHAEGAESIASGAISHAEGYSIASGDTSHAEGYETIAGGDYSHAEGLSTRAMNTSSHAEGDGSIASGQTSHAEGYQTKAYGLYSHTEGDNTIASGEASHAGGSNTIASGITSFVHGYNSVAGGASTIVLGANITGLNSNTTYVDQLNIMTIGSTAFANDIRIDANGNLTTNTSDERLKENITPLSNALLTINALQGVSYQWKDKNAGTDAVKLGFIAQQVNNIDSRLVFTNPVDGYMGLHIDGIIPLLVEAVKELSSGITISNNTHLETQTILAEDNNIDLNYSGTVETAIGGGITILHAMGVDLGAELITDENGNWKTNNDFIPNKITIPNYTPSGSTDINGNLGNVTRDDDYLYIKSSTGWKRTNLESF